MRIYHYTTIETLALILANRTIKFNRLDKVDDLDEGKMEINKIALSHLYFASCWSTLEEESIPMWHLYTDNGVGVRLSFDSETLFTTNLREGMTSSDEKELVAMINNKHYFEMPIMMSDSVNYVVNPLRVIQDRIKSDGTNPRDCNSIAIDNNVIGFTKSSDWAFQREFRFLKMVLPRDHETTHVTPGDEFNTGWDKTWELLKSGRQPEKEPGIPLESIFVRIGEDAFDGIEILLGPQCTEGHRLIVESLCKSNNIDIDIISDSRLKGHVRFK